MLALMALEQHQVTPGRGPVLVTGASGGVGSFAISLLSRAGYRVIASTGRLEQAAYLKQLGASEYIDTDKVSAAEGLQRLGGADLVLTTATNADAISSTVEGLKPRGKLLIVGVPFEPLKISVLPLITGKSIAGWPSGSAFDSEETVAFSVRSGVRAHVEVFKLEQAEEAFANDYCAVVSACVRPRAS